MDEFDIIVVGAGSAGCAVAGRLAEDPRRSVCLVEAGGRNDNVFVRTPGLLPFIPNAAKWGFETIPQRGLNGRRGYQPRGRGLGGSSSINAMVYIRGAASDYDRWAEAGCAGWSFAEVLPYFMRSEGNARGGDALHGAEGPLSVEDQRWPNPGSLAFIASAASLQLGANPDFNGPKQDGFGLYQVTQRRGERWTAARAYLSPRRNLAVHTGGLVEQILIEAGRATGIVVRGDGRRQMLRARGGVVLSAGAFGSPQLLMLSGIGPAHHLADHGVDVCVDRPAVGEGLQDHPDYVGCWQTGPEAFFGDSLAGLGRMVAALVEHRIRRTGMMTTPYSEAGGFWRSSPDLPAPDVQFHFFPVPLEDHGRVRVRGHGFSCHACVLRPQSRGSVRLQSADAAAAPLIDPNLLDDPRDIATLREGVRLMHRIVAAAPLSAYQPRDRHPIDIDDNDVLDALIRDRADTVYHPAGTCRMGGDPESVVDVRLRVRGVDALWVADASVMPDLVSGNTNAPSIMIGERCSDFVRAALNA
ncbi:GMC family oxidoreductase [Caulobacter sp. KR2-114]|uniref:GMC family oxidoreductase n=1 Tax=Caulobacter sp. KR2-114 TaxID=3400912 RepID=UPI003C0A45F0